MKHWPVGAVVVVLTLLSFYQFPGHTWLQQDSQIYTPILEHLRDPAVLGKDILVERPHVTFTLYDECALGLRKLTGLQFRDVLALEQLVTRALGIWGFYLMAAAAGLEMAPALLVAAILSLGAMIAGPQVLIFEFEPTPRAFAVPLLVLAIGLAAHRRHLGAGVAGAAAFLIHPPTVYPFWAVYACYAIWAGRRKNDNAAIAFAPLLAAFVVLFAAARFQTGQGEAQAFFTRVTPLMEKLQRWRAFYVWISMWWKELLPQYLLLTALSVAAYLRLRRQMTPGLRFFQIGLVLVGMLSMPVSWLLLEQWKWALMPQFQPLRALLFVTLCAIFSAACAGCMAVKDGRYIEAMAWFTAAYLVPVNTNILAIPDWRRPAVVLLLAALACLSLRLGRVAIAAAALAAFFLIPLLGHVVNYPNLHTPEVQQLAAWARQSTPVDAVFLFPNAGKDLSPGIFRSEALRAVYVDWKGGGQVNYLKELGEQWWSRWQEANAGPRPAEDYRKLGVDYLVLRPDAPAEGLTRVFVNARFAVYRLT